MSLNQQLTSQIGKFKLDLCSEQQFVLKPGERRKCVHGLPIGGKVDFAHVILKTEVQKSNSVKLYISSSRLQIFHGP